MLVKQIIDEDFVNYKKASMFIGCPSCSWKCEKECGKKICQNSSLATAKTISIPIVDIIDRYLKNQITDAVVIGGLEPFESFEDVINFVTALRTHVDDDIVIYTGFYKFEIQEYIQKLNKFNNIIVKFGRFIPDRPKHFDEILGVYLSSDNQYAERISNENFSTKTNMDVQS